jgi:hypothetical protein
MRERQSLYIINGAGKFNHTWENHQPLRAGRAGDTGAEPETSQLGYVWDSAHLLETGISLIVCDEQIEINGIVGIVIFYFIKRRYSWYSYKNIVY